MNKEQLKSLIAQYVKDGLSEVEATKKAEADAKSADEAKKAEVKALVDAAVAEQVEAKVTERLKEIKITDLPNINLMGKTEKELKLFDTSTGQLVEVKRVSDKYAEGNRMLSCILAGDKATAVAISNDIHKANDEYHAKTIEAKYGVKAPTPTVSDSATRGGYAIPTEVSQEILQLVYANSVMYANANKNVINFESKVYPVMYGIEIADIADQSTAATEKNPTFTNPTITMERAGAFSAISNRIIKQKGVDLLNAFKLAYSTAAARFFDLRFACGNVTSSSDLVDGIMFDANMVLDTPVAIGALTLAELETMVSSINPDINANTLKWVANRLVWQTIGHLSDTAGRLHFPQYVSGGDFSPLGIQRVVNPYIPSVLDVAGDARTGGTDNALMLVDFSKFYVGLSNDIMIDMSTDFYFTSFMTAIRGVQDYGCKLVMGNTDAAGGVARTLELSAA